MIRFGSETDWSAIVPLMEDFHRENGLAPLDLEVLKRNVIRCASRNMLLLAEEDGQIVGVLPLVECSWSYAQGYFLNDLLFYVAPQARGGHVGAELSNAAAAIAEELGVLAFLSVTNPERAGKRGRIAEIFGWAPIGYVVALSRGRG